MDSREAARIFDKVAATYDRAGIPFFESFGNALVDFARLQPDERVLDAGCGTGAVLAPASRIAAAATGVELSAAMAERARLEAPDAEVIVGDAASLTFDDASFDVVLSAFVIFFIPDPTAALREWRRVLRPGGRMVVATWGSPDQRWQGWEQRVRRSYLSEIEPARLQELAAGLALLNRFDEPSKLRTELEAAGLAVDDVREHELEFVFPDKRAWWNWNWSHGTRVFLEELPDEALKRFEADFESGMDQIRDDRGYPRRYTALFARATA